MKDSFIKMAVALVCGVTIACCSAMAADKSLKVPLQGEVANTQVFFKSDSEEGQKVTGLSITPDGSTLYCSSCEESGKVSVIDTKTGHVTAMIDVGKSPLTLAFNPAHGRLFCVNTASANVSVIDTTKNQVIGTIPVGEKSEPAALDEKKGRLYVGNTSAGTISVIDCSSQAVVQTFDIGKSFPGTSSLSDIVLSPDGERLYLSVTKAQIPKPMLYEVVDSIASDDGRQLASLPLPQCESGARIVLSNDGRNLYLTSLFQHFFMAMNAYLSSAPRLTSIGEQPGFMACSPDGQWVYICDCFSNNLIFVDAKNCTVEQTLPLAQGPLNGVMTKDGHYLWIGYMHRPYVTCVDLRTRKVVADVHNVLVR